MQSHPGVFDNQAKTYDQRVGLSDCVCQSIVQAVLALAESRPGDLVLEIGAGTGFIGTWLVRSELRYIGVDVSRGMLSESRQRLRSTPRAWLLQADGNHPWPIADGSVHILFSSRALHWLALDHVVHESLRVAHGDHALLVSGRVQRSHDSVQTMMQREMQQRLRHYGLQGRQGNRYQRQLLDALERRGAAVLEPVTAARWSVVSTPNQSIVDWQSKPGLGGVEPPAAVKHDILSYLTRWAESTFGGLDAEIESEQAYVLQGVRLQSADDPAIGR